jgi:predicted component of type VI protein secretion system
VSLLKRIANALEARLVDRFEAILQPDERTALQKQVSAFELKQTA